MRTRLAALCLFLALGRAGAFPQALAGQPPARRAEDRRISLVTILPGKSLYSAFGHSALRIRDKADGFDILLNYGLSARPFDLSFVADMLAGRMDFLVAALETEGAFDFYRDTEGRTIIEQDLDLDEGQKAAIMATLARDLRPENRTYNYRYFSDNCATRIWLILEPLGLSPPGQASGKGPGVRPSARASLNRVLERSSWIGFATGLIMGPRTDRALDQAYPLFLPQDILDWAQAAARAPLGDRPLVSARRIIYVAPARRPGPISPLGACLALLVLAGALTAGPRKWRMPRLVLDLLLYGFAAVAGLGILVFWLSAGYGEAGWNLNLLWAGPLPLLGLLLAHRNKPGSLARIIFAASALGSLVVAILGGLGLQTVSWELRCLALALALRSLDRAGFFSLPPLARLHLHIVSFANRWRSDPQD